MSKPEVVAWRALHCSGDWTLREAPTLPSTGLYTGDIEGLIRLTDHERLQAEAERLQAERAADKARIAELTEALKNAREMVADWGAYASEYFREKHGLDRAIAELDAVIAQQGRENES